LSNGACPKKNRIAQKFFTVLNILFTFRSFEQLAFALKNRVVLKIFTVFEDFLSFRIFGQLALALKTEFALKFFKPGGEVAPHDPPPRTPMHVVNYHATRGYIAYHVGSTIKELWRNEKDTQKRTHQLYICFILTKYTS